MIFIIMEKVYDKEQKEALGAMEKRDAMQLYRYSPRYV